MEEIKAVVSLNLELANRDISNLKAFLFWKVGTIRNLTHG